jgi:hypothetical protein
MVIMAAIRAGRTVGTWAAVSGTATGITMPIGGMAKVKIGEAASKAGVTAIASLGSQTRMRWPRA